MHGPIPSALMLASRVTFAPSCEAPWQTLALLYVTRHTRAQTTCSSPSPPRTLADGGRSLQRRALARPPSKTRRALPLPPIFFSTPPRTAQQPRDSGLAHSQPGHAAQVLAPLREGGGRSLLEIHLQEPPRAIVGLRGSARAPLRAQRSPFAHCLGVAFERRDAHTKGASDFDGGYGAFFGLDYLLAQVLRVGVHAPMVRQAQPYCKPL